MYKNKMRERIRVYCCREKVFLSIYNNEGVWLFYTGVKRGFD